MASAGNTFVTARSVISLRFVPKRYTLESILSSTLARLSSSTQHDCSMQTDEQFAAWEAIQRFVAQARDPSLLSRVKTRCRLSAGAFEVRVDGTRLLLQVWNRERNLVRRVTGIVRSTRNGQLDLAIEKFGKREGHASTARRGSPFREHKDADEQDGLLSGTLSAFPAAPVHGLEDSSNYRVKRTWNISLSPAFPRAFSARDLLHGPPSEHAGASDADHALTFGLIWLDYVRRREPKVAIEGLAIFCPEGAEKSTCHRLRYLDPRPPNTRPSFTRTAGRRRSTFTIRATSIRICRTGRPG